MFANNIHFLCSQLSSVIPFILGLLYYKRLNIAFRVFFFFMAFAMVAEFFIVWYARNIGNGNVQLMHVFTLVEYTSYCYLFCRELFPSKWKQLFWGLFMLELILVLANAFVIGAVYEVNSFARTFEFVVLATFSLIFFRQSLVIEKGTLPIFKQPMFWLSAGVLLYFSVNTLFFLLFNKLLDEGADWIQMGKVLHAYVNILANLLFAQAFLCFRKTI